MRIEKAYRKLEDTLEVSIYDTTEKEMYQPAEPMFEGMQIPFKKTLRNLWFTSEN